MTGSNSFPRTVIAASAVFIASCAVAFQLNDYYLYVVTIGAIFAVLAVSFDVLLGYTGYLSLAHGALYGLGAYSCAVLTANHGFGFWTALPIVGLITGAVGAIVALLSFRTRGLYFAVLTLGIGLIGHQLFLVFDEVTGGVGGFVGIPGPEQPDWLPVSPIAYSALLALALLWVTFVAAAAFVRSNLGAACLAIREDITLARALGIRVAGARLAAFTFSAVFAGLAGALFASMSNFIAPESFTVLGTGFQLVALVVVGGMGTLWGPIVGAILLTALPESLRVAATYSLLAYGVLLLVFVIFAPKGIASLLKAAVKALPRAPQPGPEATPLRREVTS
ncbi:branched-chain amino acid ABC transporter permease [Skermanella aerolata]|uniref:Branched-chain amino acid ABC transporter permease n=1 Tax=Skermanella aerolata TaxID=393310 RepID=A0A512E2W2_9PROT|nr:branched-chain amino acid ABC transporter permease [Skermanella aerolata]KJB90161.1 ABC transporter permease [Skermanella aerolata KACC 11604]GEO43045.1 branched-chain amino acid ABC transporter permease [Skermanella aerolata]